MTAHSTPRVISAKISTVIPQFEIPESDEEDRVFIRGVIGQRFEQDDDESRAAEKQ